VSDEHYCPRCNAPFLFFNGVNTRHFKCGSSTHIPSIACGYASQLQDRIKRLEEELERTKQDRNAIAKKTREPLLLKLDHAAERIKQMEDAGNNLLWNFCPEYTSDFTESQSDALKQWNKAKESMP
jgi:hypothetical protein